MVALFRRRYLISLFYLMVVSVGVVAWLNIPMELAPDISLPSVTVSHNWGSTSPEVVEQEITRKVEQLANRLRDVEKINSTTLEGRSVVTIEFSKHAPVDHRVIELQESLHGLRNTLPESVSPHSISRRVPQELSDMQNFVSYTLSGPYEVRELLEYTRQNIKNPLMGLSGLADIDITGAEDPALVVTFDSDLTERFNLDSRSVLMQIRDKLSWRSAGFTETSDGRRSILIPPEAASLDDLLRISIQIPGSSRQLSLSEIATVEVEDYPARSIRRINGSTALTIMFVKEGGSDALGLAEEIHLRMDTIRENMPAGMTLRLQLDATEDLRKQLSELQLQSVMSVLSVFIILLLFIFRLRAPFIILGSIIFSIMCSLFILYLMDYTINILTLAGLTVSLGMIIDNAIVVFEQINPGLPANREKRLKHVQHELPYAFVPVLGSTLTTIGIFIPLFFALETLRSFLVPLAVALSLTLICSVIISLTWIPYALIWLTPKGKKAHNANPKRFQILISRFVNRFLYRFFGVRRRIRWLLYVGILLVIGLPFFAISEPEWTDEDAPGKKAFGWYFENRDNIDPWLGGVSYRFFNETSFRSPWRRGFGESITVSVRPPQGSPLEEIDKIIRNFEKLGENYMESLIYFETNVSEYTGARLQFHIKEDYLFNPIPYILYAEAAYLAAKTGNVRISVSGLSDSFSTGFGGGSTNFQVRFRGYSYDDLYGVAQELQARLEQNRRVNNVDINSIFFFREDFFQYQLKVDQEKVLSKGLNRLAVLNDIQLDLNPTNTFGRVEFQNQTMYLMGRNEPRGIYQADFMNAPRVYQDVTFTLGEVAAIDKEEAMGQIRREDQSYIRQVSFDFLGPYRLGQAYLDELLETFPLPIGTTIDESQFLFSFQSEEDRVNLVFILVMALLSVWMIVSALLEKWGDPILIILAVPLSLLGVMLGTLYHGLYFEQGAIAGTLLCVGVVVNNSILLMHERERFRKAGIHGGRAWMYVYRNKMRPVLITTLTTIGGLIPLVLIGSSELWSDLATVVIWGLTSSTLLILLMAGIWEKT